MNLKMFITIYWYIKSEPLTADYIRFDCKLSGLSRGVRARCQYWVSVRGGSVSLGVRCVKNGIIV